MSRAIPDVKSVFGRAVEIPAEADRAAYLDEVCADAPEVRAEVQGLLDALGKAGSFMRAPAVPPPNTDTYEPSITEHEGTIIGPYTLREQIGEGGFGLVFVAEQQQPVRRKVALKVIKPGMDTRAVVARFEAERQALAMMDHPNIAKVFDAGSTETGRPYFVMELVKGTPITDYADANNLTPRDRLGLFLQVCHAVQHAHQKGVIHRDLKPSNILVAPHDGVPVVKVIDFGVAKALGQQLTDKTVYTRFAQMIGTPLYMSPEQAEVNQLDVDTRSDIYSLGVLLYELLTGTTPFDRDRFCKAAFDEIRRIIKEEEPPRPSARLTSLGETLTAVSAKRGTDPGRLAKVVRGELDWIVMRCLEKDRSRRYDTASNLAREVERFLKDEPIEARPPSVWYRLRKLARRNRVALTVASVVAAVVVLGAAVSLWQASLARADRERAELAEAKRIEDQAVADAKLKAQADALVTERRQNALDRAIEAAYSSEPVKARNAILAAEKAGVAPERVRWLRGLASFHQGKLEDAIQEFQASIDLKPTVAAHTMLFLAVFDASLFSGNPLERYLDLPIEGLNSTAPETAEDYLYRGFMMRLLTETGRYKKGLFKSGQAVADIDKAIGMHETPLARFFRDRAAYENAPEGEKVAAGERALAGLLQAKRQMPDNKFLRFVSLYAHMGVANICDDNGQPEKRDAALKVAGQDAEELKGILNYSYIMARVNYFERIQDKDAALAELKWASNQPETPDLLAFYALALYERGEDDKALQVLDERLKPNNRQGEMLRIILSAEQPAIGRDKAYARLRELPASRDGGGKLRWNPFELTALRVLGIKKELTDSHVVRESIQPNEQYITGSVSEEKMLQDVGKIPPLLCLAHYQVGLDRLSTGDRAGACEHFQKALDTKFYAAVIYPWARAFLARLKRDPAWPKWIPIKK